MRPVFCYIALCLSVVTGLTGCGSNPVPYFVAKDEPWRKDAEVACLSTGMVQEASYLIGKTKLKGPKPCGAVRPFNVTATAHGTVRLKPKATLQCPMVHAVDYWTRQIVQPIAHENFGQPVAEMKVISSYSCRPMNNKRGARLSEHGHANAIDISAFSLVDGTEIDIKRHWRAGGRKQAFLRALHRASCNIFSTVLGPNYDRNHFNHFHLDLARRGRNGERNVCK